MSGEFPSFLAVTPFGPYCTVCNISLSIQTGILTHGKKVHPEYHFKNASVIRDVQRRMSILRTTHANDFSSFLTNQPSTAPTWFCTGCFRNFANAFNYARHLERNKDCSGHLGGKMDCYHTICGRIGPRSYSIAPTIVSSGSMVSTLTDSIFQPSINKSLVVETSSKVPMTLLTTHEQANQILAPFVRPDEDVRDLSLIYYPLLAAGFEVKMKELLSFSAAQSGEDGILFKWLEAGREWLGNYAPGHIANVSANVRSRLAEFEQREVDGSVVGTRTFTLRRGIPRLMNELDAALRFFYRYPTTLFDSFKSIGLRNATKLSMIESAIIPKILFTAAAEEPHNHGTLPVACLYCLSRGFTSKSGTDLAMNECGWFASRISAVLHLLRAGVCGYLVTLSVDSSSEFLSVQEMEIVNRIQNGRVTNLLAPYVKRLRDLNSRKPPVKSNTVNSNGDITSGGFTFSHSVWSTLIPRIDQIAMACFNEIFEGDLWKLFLEKPIRMTNWVLLEASVADSESTIWLRDVAVKKNLEPILGKLQSAMELCFFGLGVGAVRHEEVIRLTVLSCQWHNSYLYYWTETLKRGSLKVSSTPKLVEHRLSLSLSRIVLLGRYAIAASSDVDTTDSLFQLSSSNSMLGLVQEIFDLDCPPQMLNIRHLFTSIGNVISPENGLRGSDGCLVSNTILTEKSGHTQGTGRRAYGTWMENSEEAVYDFYHRQLGESTFDPPSVDFTPFSDSVLKSSLKAMLGRDAVYRSDHQRNMIEIAANSISRHAFVGLPCGHGKSLSWMLPTIASYMAGRHVGLRIIVLPYKFLLGHVVQHALSMLGLLRKKFVVSFLDSSRVSPDSLPVELQGGDLPNLLFLNLDGAATLFRYHLCHLQNLASRNILKRVYIDEFQQILVEYGFRSSYQSLRQIGRIGVPVMCLSGSLPSTMAMSLMSYCGLSPNSDDQSIDIVKPTDPVGGDFSFDVTIVDDIPAAVIEYVLKFRVGACHVLCSSIALVETIAARLSNDLRVLSITGDSPYQEQVSGAKVWYKGGCDVLVSTVVALVGNENKLCKSIVIAGFLFNVSSLIQAIGRLRPEQRGPTSVVHVFRYPFRSVNRQDARLKCQLLFSEVVQATCLTNDSRNLFESLFSPVGLQEVLSLKEGCYLQHLSKLYGFVRLPCDRCGLCQVGKRIDSTSVRVKPNRTTSNERLATKTSFVCGANFHSKRTLTGESGGPILIKRPCTTSGNVLVGKQVSEVQNRATKVLCRKAKWVFSELQYRCIACGKSFCNGECAGGCYRCGSRSHRYTICTYDASRLAKILPNKGVCFGCFDTSQHVMSSHDMKSCPLKRRLKRLLFLDHQRRGNDFEEYLRELYSSEMSFVCMVASFSDKTSLGR
jgi:hypothetical protein